MKKKLVKSAKPQVDSEETEEVMNVKIAAANKPYTQEAHDFLKLLGKWVELKVTFPSGYIAYHEATRKFLEDFKNKKK